MTVSSSSLNAADDRIGDRTFCCCCVKWNSLPWRRLLYFRHVLLAACLPWKHGTKFRIYLLFFFIGKEKVTNMSSSTRASWWAIRLLLLSMDFHSLTQSNDLQCITYSLSPSNSILAWPGLAWFSIGRHTHAISILWHGFTYVCNCDLLHINWLLHDNIDTFDSSSIVIL